MRTFVRLDNRAYVILPAKRDLSLYTGKHMKSLETNVAKLALIGQTMLDSDANLVQILSTLEKATATEEHIKRLKEQLPDKLFKNLEYWYKSQSNYNSLFFVYQVLCNAIWSNPGADMPAKINQFDTLHELMFDEAFIEKVKNG